jgi:hypothetical protein
LRNAADGVRDIEQIREAPRRAARQEYLRALGDAWRLAEGGQGRAMVARSVFERLEASGFRELKVHLTEQARAHAFAAAIPAQLTASVGYGRGERSRA